MNETKTPETIQTSENDPEVVETLVYGDQVALTPGEYVIVNRLDSMLICLLLMVGMSLAIFLSVRRK
jgi:hypothetical protein